LAKWLVCVGLLACATAHAQPQWFTVTGNPQDVAVNTVQVDPVALSASGDLKTMNVRVSRSTQRLNWEKLPYRSYESQVVFDCRARKASYVAATFYMEPLWRGQPHKTTDYVDSPRPMLFLDIEPNPTTRIIRAACRPATA
jgi:hypothetical protein